MTDTLLLVGRAQTRETAERHAERLRERDIAATVRVATYEREPSELDVEVDEPTYVVPMAATPDRDTTRGIPGALPMARHCEPVGTSAAVGRALADRARECIDADANASVAVVAFGDTSMEAARRTTEKHAARLREETDFGEVATAYLLQNPAVECVRYNLTGDRAVAVPFFVAPCEETEMALPEKLELDRGGLAYADPLGDHGAVTDAIEAELAKARAIDSGTASVQPVATDGAGR